MTFLRRLWARAHQAQLLVGSAVFQTKGPFQDRPSGYTIRSRIRKEMLWLHRDTWCREPSFLRGQHHAVVRAVLRPTKFGST